MTSFQALLAQVQGLGATFTLGERGQLKVRAPAPLPVELLERLKEHRPDILALLGGSGITEREVASVLFTEEERRSWLILEVMRPKRYPAPPVSLRSELSVIDVPRFVNTTIQDLVNYMVAKNAGEKHWTKNLVDEKLDHLRLCGVDAEIRPLQSPHRGSRK